MREGITPPWALILAGGEGTRLRTLTTQIAGDERPKQFCALLDGETLRAQHDEWPVHNAYHSVFWRPGETIADVYDVPLPPNTASAGLRVLLIVYRAESGAEVGRIDAGSLN